jgi:hypothetical protein
MSTKGLKEEAGKINKHKTILIWLPDDVFGVAFMNESPLNEAIEDTFSHIRLVARYKSRKTAI